MINTPTISLKKLLKGSLQKEQIKTLALKQIKVTGISIDSRKVITGDAFLAYPGQQTDGRNFISMAIQQGAKAIIAEADGLEQFIQDPAAIKIVPVPNLATKVSRIAGKFYGSPSKKMSLVGVTGTNGKTSVCYLAAQALELVQKPTLLLSTLGNGAFDQLQSSQNTTSDPVLIQQLAHDYLTKNYHHLCMEVSSHGLDQNRVDGLNYKVAVFTNLSHDHLEYHGDMENYFQAKRKLFLRGELEFAVINADDSYGQKLLKDPEITAEKIAYSRSGKADIGLTQNWILSQNESFTLNGIQSDVETPWGTGRIHSNLLGDFNLSNLLAVAGVLGALLGDIHKWIVALNGAKPVIGRMQQFSNGQEATLVVDYAHTPDALEKALSSLRHHCQGKLWCLFGCGGDRDTSKRAVMGKIAEANADQVIITDDNPRTENPKAIVKMIRKGMQDKKIPYISPRREAIVQAYLQATKEDMVLVAGKGHEDYQEIGQEKLTYSDLETVQSLVGSKTMGAKA